MYCPNCGSKNKEDSQFCESCGAKLEEVGTTIGTQEVPLPKIPIIKGNQRNHLQYL